MSSRLAQVIGVNEDEKFQYPDMQDGDVFRIHNGRRQVMLIDCTWKDMDYEEDLTILVNKPELIIRLE